ncbi:histone-like nucleoid-structuring protein Lsr2 [Corynebacterium belfantii]|nr:histone-like nucleoid-structuring protein Lsr2 [Corynebacterium belfantii]
MRQWAKDNGYDIADRGILPQKVIDAYNART